MKSISFHVQGIPKAAGSKRGFALKRSGKFTGRVAIVDACKGSRAWKDVVSITAKQETSKVNPASLPDFNGGFSLTLNFYMPRPKSHFSKDGSIKPRFFIQHKIRPDALKLARAVEDALTGIVWYDDSQIVHEVITKTYADKSTDVYGPGVSVRAESHLYDR